MSKFGNFVCESIDFYSGFWQKAATFASGEKCSRCAKKSEPRRSRIQNRSRNIII